MKAEQPSESVSMLDRALEVEFAPIVAGLRAARNLRMIGVEPLISEAVAMSREV